MSENGVKTAVMTGSVLLDEIIGNKDGSTRRQTVDDLGRQLVSDGPLSAELETILSQITSGEILQATFDALAAITPAVDGTGGEVLDADTGTHSQATETGYDGATVPDAGRYTFNAAWGRWVRIGDTGLASKVSSQELAAAIAVSEDAQSQALSDAVATLPANMQVYTPNSYKPVIQTVSRLDEIVSLTYLPSDQTPVTTESFFTPQSGLTPQIVNAVDEFIFEDNSSRVAFSSGPPVDNAPIIVDYDADVL